MFSASHGVDTPGCRDIANCIEHCRRPRLAQIRRASFPKECLPTVTNAMRIAYRAERQILLANDYSSNICNLQLRRICPSEWLSLPSKIRASARTTTLARFGRHLPFTGTWLAKSWNTTVISSQLIFIRLDASMAATQTTTHWTGPAAARFVT